MQIDHDGELEAVLTTARWLGSALNKALPSMVSRAGGFP
jgi:hypothetical protein